MGIIFATVERLLSLLASSIRVSRATGLGIRRVEFPVKRDQPKISRPGGGQCFAVFYGSVTV